MSIEEQILDQSSDQATDLIVIDGTVGLLEQKGALVDYHDPYIPTISQDSWKKVMKS